VGGRAAEIYTPNGSHDVFLPLHGAHQAQNAAIALAAAEAFLGDPIDPDTVALAFSAVTSPGRLEVMDRNPLIVIDGAHNVAGAEALRRALDEEFSSGGTRTLVVGLLREKDPAAMLAALGIDDAGLLVLCPPPSPRAHAPEVVAQAARDLGFDEDRIEVAPDVRGAIAAALMGTAEDGQIVVAGSLYVVGAARSILVARSR
jgi:dihydrofolate synthase/folylpolyglutamate synthase